MNMFGKTPLQVSSVCGMDTDGEKPWLETRSDRCPSRLSQRDRRGQRASDDIAFRDRDAKRRRGSAKRSRKFESCRAYQNTFRMSDSCRRTERTSLFDHLPFANSFLVNSISGSERFLG
jgi:hypothetical protein